jgi:hypothetical protein
MVRAMAAGADLRGMGFAALPRRGRWDSLNSSAGIFRPPFTLPRISAMSDEIIVYSQPL